MNERIQKLIEQATSTQGPTPYNPLTFEVFDKEKFAESIVKECVSVLTLTVAEGSKLKINLSGNMLKIVTRIGNQYANGIIEHFGVEE